MVDKALMESLNEAFLGEEFVDESVLATQLSIVDDKKDIPLKLAVVTETWFPDINGVSHSIGYIVAQMLDLDVEIQLYYIAGDVNSEGIEIDSRIRYVRMKGFVLPFYKEVKIGYPCARKLEKEWLNNKPDIVQIVTEGALGHSAIRAAKKLRIPVVSDYHTNFQLYSTFYHVGFLKPVVSSYLRHFHNQTEATLVPTEQLQNDLHAQGFNNVEVMERGIDTDIFNPRHRRMHLRSSWGVSDDGLVILYVGRIAAEKNIALAIKAYREIQKKLTHCKFVLVGDGPLRRSLEQQHPDFIFCGMQRNDGLSQHYASADLFLAPSITETFGNTILEAMASGLALVCYDYASAGKYVLNEENAIKVPFDDEEQFISKSVQLSQDEAKVANLRKNAEISMKDISWREVTTKLLLRLMSLSEK